MKLTKLFAFFSFSLVLFNIQSCKKIEELTQFTLTYNQEFTVESNTVVNLPFNIVSPSVETNSESTFESEDTRKDLVEQIKLTSLELFLKSPSDGSFNFLDEVELFINADGLDEKRIAFKFNIPDNIGKNLVMDVSEEDLQAYVKKEAFKIRLRVETDELISRDHILDCKSTFFVDAKLKK